MKLFINYRRADDKDFVQHLRTHFAYHYGRENVFMDFDSIPYFSQFEDFIKQKIAESDVIVVIIGQNWLKHLQEREARGEKDYVRIEIEEALQLGKPLASIAIKGAPIPYSDNVPSTLAPLFQYNVAQVGPDTDILDKVPDIIKALNELGDNRNINNSKSEIYEKISSSQEILQQFYREISSSNPDLSLALILLEQMKGQRVPDNFDVDRYINIISKQLQEQQDAQQHQDVREYLYHIVRIKHRFNDDPKSILKSLQDVWQVEADYDPDNIALKLRLLERDTLYDSVRTLHKDGSEPQKILNQLQEVWKVEADYDPDNIAPPTQKRLERDTLYDSVCTLHKGGSKPQKILDKLKEVWEIEANYDPDNIAPPTQKRLERDRLYQSVRHMYQRRDKPKAILDSLQAVWKIEANYDPDNIATSIKNYKYLAPNFFPHLNWLRLYIWLFLQPENLRGFDDDRINKIGNYLSTTLALFPLVIPLLGAYFGLTEWADMFEIGLSPLRFLTILILWIIFSSHINTDWMVGVWIGISVGVVVGVVIGVSVGVVCAVAVVIAVVIAVSVGNRVSLGVTAQVASGVVVAVASGVAGAVAGAVADTVAGGTVTGAVAGAMDVGGAVGVDVGIAVGRLVGVTVGGLVGVVVGVMGIVLGGMVVGVAYIMAGAVAGIVAFVIILSIAAHLSQSLKSPTRAWWKPLLGALTPICYLILIAQYWLGIPLP
jgi:hypothetical protein